jgi:hypothetical protein
MAWHAYRTGTNSYWIYLEDGAGHWSYITLTRNQIKPDVNKRFTKGPIFELTSLNGGVAHYKPGYKFFEEKVIDNRG